MQEKVVMKTIDSKGIKVSAYNNLPLNLERQGSRGNTSRPFSKSLSRLRETRLET